MAKDVDIRKDWDEAYNIAASGWGDWLEEAEKDYRCYLGDQWDEKDKAYLTAQGRAHYVFNRVRRTVKLLTGYQRKTRLSMKVSPVGKEDDPVADQMSGIIMQLMTRCNGYNVMSDAYEMGPVITGMNLVEVYLNNDQNLCLNRLPYNKILLDPTINKRDLSDCDFILRRELLPKEQVKMLLRGTKDKVIELLPDARTDNKYPYIPWGFRKHGEKLITYDEFWEKRSTKVKMILNLQTGEQIEWPGSAKDLREYMAYNPMVDAIDRWVDKIKLHILVGGEYVMSSEDPMRLGMYPFVPLIGFWHPEVDDEKLKLQGVVRSLRDPQASYNRRISQMIDIIEGQIASGYKAKEDSLVDKESLYQTGQNKQLWMKKTAQMTDVEKIPPPDIPQGLFALNEMLDNLMTEIPGINNELFGTEEKQIPGVLSKLRQGAALTTLQDLWDNYRQSKRMLGKVLIKAAQQMYDAEKVKRIINKPVLPEFYLEDLAEYDVVVQEGLLTDSQRQMYYEEIKQMYQMTQSQQGSPIPVKAILDAAPIQMKDELLKQVGEQEKSQAEAAQKQQEQQAVLNQWQQAQIVKDIAKAEESLAQATENRTSAAYDRAKTAAEIMKMVQDGDLAKAQLMLQAAQMAEPPPEKPQPKQTPQQGAQQPQQRRPQAPQPQQGAQV
ncbi:hypothetical protein CMI37_23075 [Candidatus Pacearchaeota archaeon]|nr:hypothetical protein [Candidatus Pacearchaeota archaeon]|tara:strand:- start:1097 stop:3088 length:1992 start_codon:yes stop_codon:yes gene_type:complete